MKFSSDLSVWLLLDALAPGRYALEDLYKEPANFEAFFNRPWHGLGSVQLRLVIADLIEAKYLNVRRSKGLSPSIALTALAGREWERKFQINWMSYFDCAQRPGLRSCRGIVDFISPSEFVNWKAVLELKDEMMGFGIVGDVIKERTIRWRWSPWKIFAAASCITVEFDNGGRIFDEAFDRCWLRLEKLRVGWRAIGR